MMSTASTIPDSQLPISGSKKDIVLAFSGGLDTSFCIPYLQAQGYAVHTEFADTGGGGDGERDFIEKRAAGIGAASHVTGDGGSG
ncbi:argininosuccinate synthase, partial [Xanthomonas arboricola]|uniref:argininosuccinate synthase domain-containing protein n=1 Tax=Xanthomonas arboricola TaxID=56448 RepID=UPI0006A4F3C3